MAISTVDIPISELHLFHKNPRVGNVDEIAKSLNVNGQYRAIVVNRGTHTGRPMEVLAGNHTVKAARDLGWKTILAHVLDVDDDQASRIVLADNRTAELGVIDTDLLLEITSGLDDLEGTGYSEDYLDSLLPEEEVTLLTSEDSVPEVVENRSQLGDIWVLGQHRVICGDSTSKSVLEHLLVDDERPDILWTDPPYGVSYVGKTDDALTIQNDGRDGLEGLLDSAFHNAFKFCRDGAPAYVAHADTGGVTFEASFVGAGFVFRQNLIWAKNTLVLGRSDYHYKHEPILYGFKPGGTGYGRLGRGGEHWFGGDAKTTVLEFDKPNANRLHPTMKPVALVEELLKNSATKNSIVLDIFGGSGSTLIAAEKLGMRARLVELDPKFVDVIIGRWEEATGQVAILENREA